MTTAETPDETKARRTCVTGHRDIPLDKIDYVRQELKKKIELAIAENYQLFMSRFAKGVDLEFASIVVEMRQKHPAIRLEAAIPYWG